jgi:hypothetical protein
VDPVPDPLLLRKSGSAGNRTQISGSNDGVYHSELQGFWTLSFVRNCKYKKSNVSESGSVFRNVVFSSIRIPDDGQSAETQ